MMFHTAFDSIAVGVLLGEVFRNPKTKRELVKLTSNPWVVRIALLFALFLSPLLSETYRGSYSLPIGKSLELACIGIVISAAVLHTNTLMYKILNSSVLMYLGVLSYSLYIWNPLFLYANGRWLVNIFPYNFLCVFVTGYLSYRFVETPFLRLKDRLYGFSPNGARAPISNA